MAPSTSWLKEKPGPITGMLDARLRILLHEGDAHAAGQEEEHAVGARGADLRDLGGIVGLAELGVDLADQLALVEALEAVQRIRAGRVVRRQDEHLLDALLSRRSCRHRLMEIVVLVGDVEIVLVALLAGQRRGAGIGRQVELALRHRARHHRHGEVRPDDAGQHVDLVALDHLVGDLHGESPASCASSSVTTSMSLLPDMLHRQHEAVAHVDAEAGAAARKRGDHADLHRFGEGQARHAQARAQARQLQKEVSFSLSHWFQALKVPKTGAVANPIF